MPTKKGSWRDKGKGECFTRTNKGGGTYVVCNDPPRGSKGQASVYKSKKDKKKKEEKKEEERKEKKDEREKERKKDKEKKEKERLEIRERNKKKILAEAKKKKEEKKKKKEKEKEKEKKKKEKEKAEKEKDWADPPDAKQQIRALKKVAGERGTEGDGRWGPKDKAIYKRAKKIYPKLNLKFARVWLSD